MTPSARLQAVLDILQQFDAVHRPADALASDYFRARRYIGSHDRGAIAQTFYDCLRHHGRTLWWLDKKKSPTTARARLIAYLMLVVGKKTEDIEGLFNGGKFAPSALDKDEQEIIKHLRGHTINHPQMDSATRTECPAWARDSLQQRFGEKFEWEMSALLNPAPLDLRINSIKTDRDTILRDLKSAKIPALACVHSPLGIRIATRPALHTMPMLKDGLVEIQDEGSQLAAQMVDAKVGDKVIDLCAGAGGKTLVIATQMQNKGRVIACDLLANRLRRSSERFRKAGLHNISTHALDGESDVWLTRHKGTCDRVLADVPCSGTGVWRRNPDARLRMLGPGLENLLMIQAKLLLQAATLVKKGGRLVYATCSLLPEENEAQITKFLELRTDFKIIPYAEVWQKVIGTAAPSEGEFLRLTPAGHETDGFFAAVLEKT